MALEKSPLVAGLAVAFVLLYGCKGTVVTGGSPARGKESIRRYGCGACHSIPGVAKASGQVGPPLDGIGRRAVLAGKLPNTPENLMGWIRNPQGVAPGTAMPELGVTERDARDIAAYLYTLR